MFFYLHAQHIYVNIKRCVWVSCDPNCPCSLCSWRWLWLLIFLLPHPECWFFTGMQRNPQFYSVVEFKTRFERKRQNVCVHVHANKHSIAFPLMFERQGLSLNLEVIYLVWLASEPWDPPVSAPQQCDYRYTLPCPTFHVGAGNQTHILSGTLPNEPSPTQYSFLENVMTKYDF